MRAARLLAGRARSRASGGPAAPSFFGARGFGRYVATHFFPGADLHGHRPAVLTRPRPSALCAPAAPYLCARFGPPCARCLPAHAHSARRRPRVRSSRRPSAALPRAARARRLSCGTFRREPATRQFDGSFAATPRSQDRFARQAPLELLPGLPPPSLAPGVVHRLSGRCARTPRARRAAPSALRRARAQRSLVRVSRRAAHSPAGRPRSRRFRAFSLCSRSAFLLSLAVLLRYRPAPLFSLRWAAPPLHRPRPSTATPPARCATGLPPSPAERPARFCAAGTPPAVRRGLLPFRSPLLRESVFVSSPPRTDMLKSRGSPRASRARHSAPVSARPFASAAPFLARTAEGSPAAPLLAPPCCAPTRASAH